MGYPSLAKSGIPPLPLRDGLPLFWIGYAWTGYVTGVTSLAVSHRRTFILPPASKGWGKVIVSVCLSVHTLGYPIPGSFSGHWSQVLSEGTPSQVLSQVTCPRSFRGGGVPHPGVPPSQGWGTPMEYLILCWWYTSCVHPGVLSFSNFCAKN